MFCHHCGNHCQDDHTFCVKCGTKVAQSQDNNVVSQNNERQCATEQPKDDLLSQLPQHFR